MTFSLVQICSKVLNQQMASQGSRQGSIQSCDPPGCRVVGLEWAMPDAGRLDPGCAAVPLTPRCIEGAHG